MKTTDKDKSALKLLIIISLAVLLASIFSHTKDKNEDIDYLHEYRIKIEYTNDKTDTIQFHKLTATPDMSIYLTVENRVSILKMSWYESSGYSTSLRRNDIIAARVATFNILSHKRSLKARQTSR